MNAPRTKDEFLAFARTHREQWETNLGILRIAQQDIDLMASLIDQSDQDKFAADAAKDAARSLVAIENSTIGELRKLVGGLLTTIEATAKLSDDPTAIWAAADLPEPKTPRELKTPPTPVSVTAQINATGGVDIAWKNPTSDAYKGATYFIIERQLRTGNTLSPFKLIASPADRSFTDTTVPPGHDGATYRVSATRNNKTSQPATVEVNFGVGLDESSSNASNTSSSNGENLAEAA